MSFCWEGVKTCSNTSLAVPRSIVGCDVSHIGEVAHSDGGVKKII